MAQGPAAGRLLALLERASSRPAVWIACDHAGLQRALALARFFQPERPVLPFPAWGGRPYDFMPPARESVASRLACLARLAEAEEGVRPPLVVATVAAVLQRLPEPAWMRARLLRLRPGETLDPLVLQARLSALGYRRAEAVASPGEYAVRGGLVDLFPPGGAPLRLDFHGDALEQLRTFDPLTQRSTPKARPESAGAGAGEILLAPASEFIADEEAVARFRLRWRQAFGAAATRDDLYAAVSEGRSEAQQIHYLPFFHERLALLPAYLAGAAFAADDQAEAVAASRQEEVRRGWEARQAASASKRGRGGGAGGAAGGHGVLVQEDPPPLPPEALYADWSELQEAITSHGGLFSHPGGPDGEPDPAPDFAGPRAEGRLFPALGAFLQAQREATVLIAATTPFAAEHLSNLVAEHELGEAQAVASLAEVRRLPKGAVGVAELPLERGFLVSGNASVSASSPGPGAAPGFAPGLAVLGEHDILGERYAKRGRRTARASASADAASFAEAIADLHALDPGDLVVHQDYGIGRFARLEQITAAGAAHECLRIDYRGGDSLLLPVESLDRISRYGEGGAAELDALGRGAWQARKARVAKRLRDIARHLIAVAAARKGSDTPPLAPPGELYAAFCRRFPWAETPDQLRAIRQVEESLASGRLMEHLVCGDAGFGKTEVALRAACIVAGNGRQVAILAPTTLLADQHWRNFRERFAGLPFRLAPFSRLVPARERAETAERLAAGEIDIVIGTHALLAGSVRFADLGLAVIDEEQRFGVRQKERLKGLRPEPKEPKEPKEQGGQGENAATAPTPAPSPAKESRPHILTLSATPIPRTLQLALGGVTDMSLISTPPPDRSAVRSFIAPWDPVAIREALLREKERGGQSFVVAPRVADLERIAVELPRLVPELVFCSLHGGAPASEMESVMRAFLKGERDVLLSTDIIESGLDIPNANTLVVWRADLFGLAQLYQLRGRVGRGKAAGWSYFTVLPQRTLTPTAVKRFEALRRLDGLGVGFSLAAADLELRGGGNLLGEEQSGHLREVGPELYQEMLEGALAEARAQAAHTARNTARKGRGKGRGPALGRSSGTDDEALDATSALGGEGSDLRLRIGVAMFIPESYAEGLSLRLQLYRRIARLSGPDDDARTAFLAELDDRFGPPPRELLNLVEAVRLKGMAARAGLSGLDASRTGLRVHFASGFAAPAALASWLQEAAASGAPLRLAPSGVLEYRADLESDEARLKSAARLLAALEALAQGVHPLVEEEGEAGETTREQEA